MLNLSLKLKNILSIFYQQKESLLNSKYKRYSNSYTRESFLFNYKEKYNINDSYTNLKKAKMIL